MKYEIPSIFNTKVGKCARCGIDHDNVSFSAFKEPLEGGFSHYGMCPTLNQPILMRILAERD